MLVSLMLQEVYPFDITAVEGVLDSGRLEVYLCL